MFGSFQRPINFRVAKKPKLLKPDKLDNFREKKLNQYNQELEIKLDTIRLFTNSQSNKMTVVPKDFA